MKKLYVIQWKSKVNGRAGKGTKLFDQHEGDRLVEELNREYPQIHHELLESAPSASAAGSSASTESAPAMELAAVEA